MRSKPTCGPAARRGVVEILECRRLLSGGNTPYFGTPFAANQTIYAVNYDKGGEGVAYHDTTAANLGGDNYRPGDRVDIQKGGSTGNEIAYTAAGEWLDYTITVPATGTYKLETAVASAAPGASFHAEFEGTNLKGTNLTGSVAVPSSGSFSKFLAVTAPTTFKLTAGKTTMRIVFDKAAGNGYVGDYDWFKFVQLNTGKDTYYLNAPFKSNGIIPAADYDNGGEGVSYHDTTPTNLGGDTHRPGDAVDIQAGGTTGNVVSYAVAGEWIDYTINIAAAGKYELQATVANAASGGSFHAEFEGTNLAGKNLTGAISIPNTGGWTKFKTMTSTSFSLPAGQTIMRIVLDKNAVNNAVGNFDYFKVISV
jgi:hypothetical protein